MLASLGLMLSACAMQPEDQRESTFKGKIAESYEDSEEWWPDPIVPPEGAPNVLIVMLDDAGYSSATSFGGVMKTPTFDRIGDEGTRARMRAALLARIPRGDEIGDVT